MKNKSMKHSAIQDQEQSILEQLPDELIPEFITRLAKGSSLEGDRTMSNALAQTEELLIRQYGAEAVLTGKIPD